MRLGIRRSGISGVLAAVILFAMIFTVGSTFFLFISQSSMSNSQAANTAEASLQAASGEQLSIEVHIATLADFWGNVGDLWISANNTGSLPSTITAIFVESSSGGLASSSLVAPGSHYLSTDSRSSLVKGDLNLTLPITVPVGGSTKQMSGCGPSTGCNIAISRSVYAYTSGAVVVSVLTATGRVFSATYPPPALTTTTRVTLDSVTQTTTLVSSGNGGNAIAVQLAAAPNQVLSGATITVTAQVYSYATSVITGAFVTLNTPSVTGTASVTVLSACSPATQPLPAYSGSGTPTPVSFTCTYTSNTGSTGGFASFSGYAQGTFAGNLLTSAEALSNTVQIGGASSVTTQGAFAANFFFFKYSGCTNQPSGSGLFSYSSPCTTNPATMPPASTASLADGNFISGGGSYYVAYYVELSNNFNTTLPILDYSYLFLDPGISGEQYNFLVGTGGSPSSPYYPNYGCASGCTNDVPTLTPYTGTAASCAGTPPPSSCIDVAPGGSVVLTFAACGFGSSSWEWGGYQDASRFDNGASGCTSSAPSFVVPQGLTLNIIVSYLYKGNVYSQELPFEGQIQLRSTSTTPSCSPSTFNNLQTSTCTATVSDTDAGGSYMASTGTVSFAASPASSGSLSASNCTLSGSGDSTTCSVTFTPSLTYIGTATITASYQGDQNHWVSTGTTTITVVPVVTTTLSASAITAGYAVVDNTAIAPAVSGGTVTYYYSTSNSCPTGGATTVGTVTVGANGVVPASAGVTFNTAGTYYWYASYSDGAVSQCEPLTVTKTSPTIATAMTPTTIVAGAADVGTDTLSGATSVAGGTVTTYTFSGSACGGSSTVVATVPVTNGVVPSISPPFTVAGSFSWDAVYSGDGGNNGATSACKTFTVSKASPTLTTVLSPTAIDAGSNVSATATLASDSGSNTGGTVTYTYYTGASCGKSATATVVGTVTVSGGVVPASSSVEFDVQASWSWNAAYSGDANNNAATSACVKLVVADAAPVLSTTFQSASPMTVGSSEIDTSVLSSASGIAAGTVSYYWYATAACTSTSHLVGSAVTVADGVVPNSTSLAFNTVGPFSWHAVYSGDTNDKAATSACEPLTVSKASPTVTTAFQVSGALPPGTILAGGSVTDTATMSGGAESPSGSLTYSYYTGATCAGASTLVSTVTVAAGVIPNAAAHAFSTAGLYSYIASYAGDTNNNAYTGSCEPLSVISFAASPTSVANTGSGVVTLSSASAGYSTSTTYSYCLSTSASAVSGCVSGTKGTFVGVGTTGTIPSDTLTVPSGQATGTYYVIVYVGTTVLISATETVT